MFYQNENPAERNTMIILGGIVLGVVAVCGYMAIKYRNNRHFWLATGRDLAGPTVSLMQRGFRTASSTTRPITPRREILP